MARLRRREPGSATDVPPEFYDVHAPAWASLSACRAWCRRHGVEPPGSLVVDREPSDRLATVIGAYAVAAGHVSGPRGRAPDRQWLAATGLADVAAACMRAKVERIKMNTIRSRLGEEHRQPH